MDRQGDPQGQACCGKQARWGPVTKRGVLGVGVHSHNKAAEDRPGGCATIQVVAAGLCLYADYANGWVGSVGAQDGAWSFLTPGCLCHGQSVLKHMLYCCNSPGQPFTLWRHLELPSHPGLPRPGCAPGAFPASVATTESTTGSGLHSRLPRGVRPRLEGKPRTPLSSRVATRVSWNP